MYGGHNLVIQGELIVGGHRGRQANLATPVADPLFGPNLLVVFVDPATAADYLLMGYI
jgi:hypothetical protein